MPTYEYECKICGHNFEIFQSMSDAPLSDCPECGRELRRLINGGSGVIFKGSGFYVNDKNKERTGKQPPKSSGKTPEKSDTGEAKSASNANSTSAANGACAACPASAASGGPCPAPEKAAG